MDTQNKLYFRFALGQHPIIILFNTISKCKSTLYLVIHLVLHKYIETFILHNHTLYILEDY